MVSQSTAYSQNIGSTRLKEVYTNDQLPDAMRYVDDRSFPKRVFDAIAAPLRDLAAALESVPSRLLSTFGHNADKAYCSPEKADTWNRWNEKSSSLHLFTHGFQGHPSIWNRFVQAVRERDQEADLRVPFVTKKGNCSLNEATQPIQAIARSYINEQIKQKK